MTLDNELREVTIVEFCTRVKRISYLDNTDAKVPERKMVMYAINGLSSKYANVATIIRHKTTFLAEVRSILTMEEQKMKHNENRSSLFTCSHSDHSSSPITLPTQHRSKNQNYRRGNNVQ